MTENILKHFLKNLFYKAPVSEPNEEKELQGNDEHIICFIPVPRSTKPMESFLYCVSYPEGGERYP